MKFLSKVIVLFCLFLGSCAGAEPYKVLVLPVDLFAVCENYYCFPEVSEIVAEDVIYNFNKDDKIFSPDLYEVRKKMSENSQLKTMAASALNKYKTYNSIDFDLIDKLANAFDAKSVMMISGLVIQDNSRRSIWEVLEVSTAFDIYNAYSLETTAVLTDNVNDIVMWSGKYKRLLADNDMRFWAKSSAAANSQLEKIRFYSRDILAKNITENVTLRFYPKSLKPAVSNTQIQTDKEDFRPNPLGQSNIKLQSDKEYEEIESEMIYNF